MDMRAPNTPLEHGPEGFQPVHMNVAARIFLASMVDHLVVIPEVLEDAIRGPFVGRNARTSLDALEDRRNKALTGSVRNNLGKDLAVTLKDTHNDGLALGPASGVSLLFAPAHTADISFVNLNMAGQRGIAVNGTHIITDDMRHAERRGIGNPKLALKFLGGNAVARRAEQIHGVKPLLQRRMGTVEGRPDHRVNVMAAPRAGISGLFLDANKPAFLVALGAIKNFAVAQFHKVIQTGVVVGKLLHKVHYGRVLGHFSLHLIQRVYH